MDQTATRTPGRLGKVVAPASASVFDESKLERNEKDAWAIAFAQLEPVDALVRSNSLPDLTPCIQAAASDHDRADVWPPRSAGPTLDDTSSRLLVVMFTSQVCWRIDK